MPISTQSLDIHPDDGWTLVATNPTYLFIQPSVATPWRLAVTASGVPLTTTGNLVFKQDEFGGKSFTYQVATAGTALFYIKADRPRGLVNGHINFGVLRDQA